MAGTNELMVATAHGLVLAGLNDGAGRERERMLQGREFTSLITRDGVTIAGTTDGAVRSSDSGRSWQDVDAGLTIRHLRRLAFHPDVPDLEFAGTEPAGIFVSRDGGDTWRGRPEVEALRDRHKWWLPYSPEAGCVRGFAFHGDRAYAAVEVGGVLRSDDAGETWRLARGSTGQPAFDMPPANHVFADVHSIEVHPSSADLVYAPTAEGLYLSTDGGDTWTVTHAGSYCRAVWVDPSDPDHLILSPAESVSNKNATIVETHDRGSTWKAAVDGLDLPWPNRMVERFTELEDQLLAVTDDGRLYQTPLGTVKWQRILTDVPDIRAVVAA